MSREELRDWLRRLFEPEAVRRRTHRGALVACALFAFVVALALFRPGIYTVGPVVIKLTSLRNPLLELGAAVLVALATSTSRSKRRVRFRLDPPRWIPGLWSGWRTGGWIFALALAVKVVITAVNVARLPDRYLSFHRGVRTRFDEPLEAVFAGSNRYAQLEAFFERCRLVLPDDARVLYSGRSEGQLLAYVIYPRPVFMHPADRYVAWIGHQVLDLGRALPHDELFPGSLAPPIGALSLEAFVGAHRITHEVRFVESDLASCRVGPFR